MDAVGFLGQEEVKEFICKNVDRNVNQLVLNPPKKWKDHVKIIADQILSRQKAKGKLPSWTENFDLILPPPLSVEQASSEVTGQYKAGLLNGKHLIDLTGGMGIDCLCMGQRFKKITYVESNADLCEVFRHNSASLKREIEIKIDTAKNFLDSFKEKATFYLDPSRRDDTKQKVFRLEDCTPNFFTLQRLLAEKSEKVLVKFSPLVDLSLLIDSINHVSEIHVVSVKNECKEVLLLIDPHQQATATKVVAVNLNSDEPHFSFIKKEEETMKVAHGKLSTYLYEPNASVLKAGGFKSIAQHYHLGKLHSNTHLYTSNSPLDSFPGRSFKVISSNIKDSLQKYAENGHINVITRNYPLDSVRLKRKYKLKDGGSYYLIGFRDVNNKPQLIIADRLQ